MIKKKGRQKFRESARGNGNIAIAVVIVDVVHVQPITIKVERAANRADHICLRLLRAPPFGYRMFGLRN
jgi:hypothetical protein